MTNSDRHRDDPYLQVLVGIASELSQIKMELQRMNDAPAEPDVESFECRCGDVLPGETAAERHARDDHNAPKDAWREMYA